MLLEMNADSSKGRRTLPGDSRVRKRSDSLACLQVNGEVTSTVWLSNAAITDADPGYQLQNDRCVGKIGQGDATFEL